MDDIFRCASNCILQICDTMCVSNTGVVMYEAKKIIHSWYFNALPLKFRIVRDGNLIECLLVEFCQYGAVFEVYGKKLISNEGFLKLSFDIGCNTFEI